MTGESGEPIVRAALLGWRTLNLFSDVGGGGSNPPETFSVTDIELVFVGVFGAWLGLTGAIFKILGPTPQRHLPSDGVPSGSKALEEPAASPPGKLVPAQSESATAELEARHQAARLDDEGEAPKEEEVNLDSFDPEIWRVLLAVCNEEGEVEPNALAEEIRMPPVRVLYYLEQLENLDFVADIGPADEYGYVDTPAGRAHIVENDLDR